MPFGGLVSEIVKVQGLNIEAQRMIRILAKQETPPSLVNFASTFLKTLQKPKKA